MTRILTRIAGFVGFMGIIYTWYLWTQFFISLMANPSVSAVLVGLAGIIIWFIGEVFLTLLGGAICLALLFT